MHNIGDYIMYGGAVRRICAIGKVDFTESDREYYILEEADVMASSKTYVPTDNERLTSGMRPLLTKEEIYAIKEDYDNIPELEWKSDNKQRSESFRHVTESQDARSILGMIKSIEKTAKARQAEGKKSYITDTNALARAKKILSAEISFVLGTTEAEAWELLTNK